MDELRKEYTLLFNGITETIKGLESTVQRLKLLQQAAENTYLDTLEQEYGSRDVEPLLQKASSSAGT